MLRKRWLAGSISDQRFAVAIEDLEDLDLDRYPTLPLTRRGYELRANLTATTLPTSRSPNCSVAGC